MIHEVGSSNGPRLGVEDNLEYPQAAGAGRELEHQLRPSCQRVPGLIPRGRTEWFAGRDGFGW